MLKRPEAVHSFLAEILICQLCVQLTLMPLFSPFWVFFGPFYYFLVLSVLLAFSDLLDNFEIQDGACLDIMA